MLSCLVGATRALENTRFCSLRSTGLQLLSMPWLKHQWSISLYSSPMYLQRWTFYVGISPRPTFNVGNANRIDGEQIFKQHWTGGKGRIFPTLVSMVVGRDRDESVLRSSSSLCHSCCCDSVSVSSQFNSVSKVLGWTVFHLVWLERRNLMDHKFSWKTTMLLFWG